MTTKSVNPKARAILSRALVLERKHDPGAAASHDYC